MDWLLRGLTKSLVQKLVLAALAAAAAALLGCSRPELGASSAEHLAVLESGHLLARRAALATLGRSVPATPGEMESLLAAAKQESRRRFRKGARRALRNVPAQARQLRAFCPRLLEEEDAELAKSGILLCRRLGVAEAEPRIAALLASHPSWHAEFPDPESFRAAAPARRRLRLIEAAYARLGPEGFAALQRRAAPLIEAKDAAGLERILEAAVSGGSGD